MHKHKKNLPATLAATMTAVLLLLDVSYGRRLSFNNNINDDGHHKESKVEQNRVLVSEYTSEDYPEEFPNPSEIYRLTSTYRPYEATDCATDCARTEFCGTDSQCHTNSCDQIYEFGIKAYTRYDPDTSEDLNCINFAPGERDRSSFPKQQDMLCGLGELPSVVTFGCKSIGRSSCPQQEVEFDDLISTVQVNRKCTAKTTNQHFFACYDIAPGTDLDAYFANYIEATDAVRMDNVQCDEDDGLNRTQGLPFHDYLGIEKYVYLENNIDVFPRLVEFGVDIVADESEKMDFNPELAASVVHVSSDLVELGYPFPRCKNDDGCEYNEFCGIDEACHSRTCENIYEFGPTELTGNKAGKKRADDGLTCTTKGLSDNDDPIAACGKDEEFPIIAYSRCYDRFTGGSCRRQELWWRPEQSRCIIANRKCTAQPNAGQTFTCYDISPETDLVAYAQPYLDSIASNSTICQGYGGNNPSTVVHIVHGSVKRFSDEDPDSCDFFPSFESYLTLDPELMLKYVLDIEIATESSTASRSNQAHWLYHWIPLPILILSLHFI